MKSFEKFIDAESYAMEVSAQKLKSISIVKRMTGKNFIVCDEGGSDAKCHDQFVMLISNYETPFEVHYTSIKAGKIIQGFALKELRDEFYKELINHKYKDVIRVDLTPEQYYENWVKPYLRSKEISNEYRKTLIEA